jgi:hypothetical protein
MNLTYYQVVLAFSFTIAPAVNMIIGKSLKYLTFSANQFSQIIFFRNFLKYIFVQYSYLWVFTYGQINIFFQFIMQTVHFSCHCFF